MPSSWARNFRLESATGRSRTFYIWAFCDAVRSQRGQAFWLIALENGLPGANAIDPFISRSVLERLVRNAITQ